MDKYVELVLMVSAIIAGGVGLILLARWSRRRNEKLKASHNDSQKGALEKILDGEDLKNNVASYFTSSVSGPEAFLGRLLALGVVLFVVAFFLWVIYMIYLRH